MRSANAHSRDFPFLLSFQMAEIFSVECQKVQWKLIKPKQSIEKSNAFSRRPYAHVRVVTGACTAEASATCFPTLSLSKCPLLIVVKVRVAADSWSGSKGVSQEAIFAIKWVTVAVFCWKYSHPDKKKKKKNPGHFLFKSTDGADVTRLRKGVKWK